MDIEKTFPLRYFINLGRRQDRRVETEIALEDVGFTAERFPAVAARFVKKTRGYESAGRYALALSQRLVLRQAALKKAEAVLILEDDVVFHPRLLEKLAEIELPDDWGIFYLGCAHQRRPWPAGKGLVRTPYALDTHAFGVREPYYRKVMAALSRHSGDEFAHPRASDWYLANLHREIPTYACYPNLAWQAVAESDLAGGTYSNYTPSGEQISARGETVALQGEIWGARRWRPWHRPELAEDSPEDDRKISPIADPPAVPLPNRAPPVRIDPKLALLFLTRGDVNHPGMWREFMAQAGDEVRIFSHAKDVQAAGQGFLAGSDIEERWDTKWGDISLVRAMMSLLKAALADEALTHFAFLSESCVPVRPWQEIRRRLRLDPRSMVEWQGSEEMEKKHRDRLMGVEDLPDRAYRVHSQWVLLDREGATCVTEVDLTERFEGVFAADEHYIGSMLALRGYPDERINRQSVTWARWHDSGRAGGPKEFGPIAGSTAAELAAFPGFFARKFLPASNIGDWGFHEVEEAYLTIS
jgi:hypothetical protein